MELGLDNALKFRRASRRQRRQTHARWWFAQMRQIVNNAPEPIPVATAQPEQNRSTPGTPSTEPLVPEEFDLN